jgi:hypothetical protein
MKLSVEGLGTSTFAGGLQVKTGGLQISTLASCDTIDTDASGNFRCGADAGGAGSQTPWTSNIDGGGFNLANVGTIGIGTSSPYKGGFTVDSGVSSTTNTYLTGNVANYLQLNIQNRSASAGASSDIVATADNGTETTHYVNMGINGSGGGNAPFGTANQAYLYSIDDSLNIGALGASSYIAFHTTGGTSPVERLRIDQTGNVGIGSSSPWGLLSVNPNNLLTGVPEFVIGSSTGTHFIVEQDGDVGIGTTSPYAKLSVIGATVNGVPADERDPLFVFATSTAWGPGQRPILYGFATTTGKLDYARVAIGTTSPWGNAGIRDQLTVDGRIYSTWRYLGCDFPAASMGVTNMTTADTNLTNNPLCGFLSYDVTTDGLLSPVVASTT